MNEHQILNKIHGLTGSEAHSILLRDGYNELPSQKNQSTLTIFLHILSEPMLLLLVGGGALYLFMGEINDALILLLAIFVVVGITFYQEKKTEKTLTALKSLSSPRALVIRGGKQIRIPGREVVKNDIIIIREGDRIPADATILSSENLLIDESLLTGESVPVRKTSWDGKMESTRPGGDDLPFVYSGSMAVGGHGIAIVHRTGINTEMGKIGKSINDIKEEDTLLHRQTAKIVRYMAIIGGSLCLLVVIIYVLIRQNLTQGLLAGLSLSMAMLPEEFPVVLLIFLTMGAWRISRRKVLTRRSAAIETLGAATVLCTDKTGTLTINKMKLTSLYCQNSFYEVSQFASTNLPEKFHRLLEYGILASQSDPFDPIEKEIKKFGELYLKDTSHLHRDWSLVKEYPLSKNLLALSHIWVSPNNHDYIIASKGAPEAIINLCHLTSSEKSNVLNQVIKMSSQGLRVIGVAKSGITTSKLPSDQHKFNFEFVGLLGFIDPIRQNAPPAISQAYEAGMRVIMITGDYPGTAQYIAKKIGINNPDNFITGEELDKMNHLDLRERIKTTNIFARVVPEQKLLIVNALKANGEIVAMTGDGVNDAPALKSAHIGIAMGQRGTDVAREASSLVLLNDDFSSIVEAVRLGRRIFDNLKRAMGYIISVHIPIAGMAILPLFFDFPIVLLPANIAFLELIIDPSCSIVFESEREDAGIMRRPPRNLREPLFSPRSVALNILQGFSILIATFSLYLFSIWQGLGAVEARSIAFATLVIANLLLITTNLSWKKNFIEIILSANKILYIVLVTATFSLVSVLSIPFLSDLFHLTTLYPRDYLLISVFAFASLSWFEILKILNKYK